VFRYNSVDALREHLTEVSNGWARDLIEATKAAAADSVTPI
jgi:hypothetical protein